MPMTTNSNKSKRASPKPYPEYPLTAHPSGRWRKIHRGTAYYFGPLDDWEAALERYKHAWPYILKGKPVPDAETGNPEGTITLSDAINAFIEAKRELLENAELSPRTYADTIRTGKLILKAIDRNRDIETIGPADFAKLRKVLAKGRSLVVLGVQITRCRSVFKFAIESGMRSTAIRYGQSFNRPSRKAVRVEKSERVERYYSAAECQKLIDAAPLPLRAMVLLGLNAALGNTDIGALKMSHIDLDAGVVAMPRPKTGSARRAILWPETVKAVREAIEARPTPDRDAEGLVFVTKFGKPWVRSKIVETTAKGGKTDTKLSLTDSVGGEFKKLVKATELTAKGRSFYALRHTFRTVADSLSDRPAIDLYMGHDDPADMRGHYVAGGRVDDGRLRAVSDHVRRWLSDKETKS